MLVDRVDLVALPQPFPLPAGETGSVGIWQRVWVGFGYPVVALLEHWTGPADFLTGPLPGDTHFTGDRFDEPVVPWAVRLPACCSVGPPFHLSRVSTRDSG
jgi:hypothetical protein